MLQGKWLLKHRFVHEKKNEIRKHTTRTKKKLATPGIEFVQIKKEKGLDFVHLQVR